MRVLVIDPAPSTRAPLVSALAGAGHEVVEAETPRQALRFVQQGSVEAVVCDEYLPGPGCVDVVREVLCQRRLPALAVIDTAATLAGSMFSSGAHRRIAKPVDPVGLIEALTDAMHPPAC
jgi:two-component system response regulator AtoC